MLTTCRPWPPENKNHHGNPADPGPLWNFAGYTRVNQIGIPSYKHISANGNRNNLSKAEVSPLRAMTVVANDRKQAFNASRCQHKKPAGIDVTLFALVAISDATSCVA